MFQKEDEKIVAICDDNSLIWSTISKAFENHEKQPFRIATKTNLREGWDRFKHSEIFIIEWEGERNGGAILEEIKEIDPHFNISQRVIVGTTSPNREDVIYFSELGVQKLARLPQNKLELNKAVDTLKHLISDPNAGIEIENQLWIQLQRKIDHASDDGSSDLAAIKKNLESFRKRKPAIESSARYYEFVGRIALLEGSYGPAESSFLKAIEVNPNFYRSYNGLIDVYNEIKEFDKALAIIRKLQSSNKNNISRMVKMGDIYGNMNDDTRAEHYYELALEKDQKNGAALNGLAKIRFKQGRLDESKELLSKSCMASKLASYLNQEGIVLVKQSRFEDALQHYSNAQYVLPQQDKGPMLFYNIGLCYSRWGKFTTAAKFLKLALIKSPTYEKARRLLDQVELRTQVA